MQVTLYYPVVTEKEKKLPLYITTIGTTEGESYIYRPGGIENCLLLYSREGCGKAKINGRMWDISEGSLLVLPPFTTHDYYNACDNWITDWVSFNGSINLFDLAPGVYALPGGYDFPGKIKNIINYRDTIEWSIKSSALLYELLLDLKENIGENIYFNSNVKRILAVCFKYIEENLSGVVELPKIASAAGVSGEHLCRIFKSYTGMRPFEYINNLRVQRAKELLFSYPEIDIKTVSGKVGFQSESYFAKVFKKNVGKTPGEYRKEHIGY